jgi:type IV pilus assembly protein PilN
MTAINLLPWREMRRKEHQRQFFSVSAGAAILMAMIVFYIHIHIGGLIGAQNDRNTFLKDEISKVEKMIAEIRTLQSEKQALLARMNIIQQLQTRRPEIVHIFDEIVRAVPGGIYLTSIKQQGTSFTIEGVAQSNARVSSFMRNLDTSDWFANPRLEVIEANDKDKVRTSRFKLLVSQVNPGDKGEGDTEAAQ